MSSLLPPSATSLMRALDQADAAALDAVDVDQLATLASPWSCPVAVIPYLAWAYSVDTWSQSWTEAEQREVVGASLRVHARKGTRGGIEDAVAPFGGGLLLEEWWQAEPPATPHTFTVRVIPGGSIRESDWFRALFDTLDQAKPLRDHYTALVDQQATGNVEIGVVASSAVFVHYDATVERAA
ncbi:MAG: phage tail protein I [Salinisphaeraceae bacterium]